MDDTSTTVWITGASSGIGAALAASVPWPDAVTFDVSRRGGAPGTVHVPADLADPDSWPRVTRHVSATLADRAPRRAVMVHNAAGLEPMGPAHAVDPEGYAALVLLDSAAPQVLGAGFLAAVADAPSVEEAVLVVLTSGAARSAYPGWSAYGAGKAAVDHWVRTVGLEQQDLDRPVRAVAVAPGVVDTAMQTAIRASDDTAFPNAPRFRELHAEGALTSPEDAAAGIWDVVSDPTVVTGSVVDLRDRPGR